MVDQNYLAEVAEQYQAILTSPGFVEARRLLSGDSLLSQVQDNFELGSSEQADDLISVAFAIEQTAIRLWTGDESAQFQTRAQEAFEASAKLFEYLAESRVASEQVILDLYLHSAVDFSLGEFQANAMVLARKVLGRFEFGTGPHARVLRATFHLLLRDLSALEKELGDLGAIKNGIDAAAQLNLSSENPDWRSAMEDIAHTIASEAIASFSRYLRTGHDEYYDVARRKIQSSLEVLTSLRDPDNFVLTHLISLLIRQMRFSSLWHQLGDLCRFRENPILARYVHVLTSDQTPIYELWHSQIEAIPKLLSNASAIVLQMPTSAGKTRIAEIKIAHTLATNHNAVKCIYIAPFKSLAAQVEKSLGDYLTKVGYRVTSIFGSYESIDFEELLAAKCDVLVITPEKLDYLLRQDRDFFDAVKLVVVDEGHLLDNDTRGLRLEILLERLKRGFSAKGLQILFVSAVVPNSDEVASWLSTGEPIVAESKWKPTRLRQGIFYWGDDWRGSIRYRDDRLTLNTGIERRMVQEFSKGPGHKRLKTPIYYPDNKNQIAVELALAFLKASPTIIFTAVRSHVNSIAANLYTRIQELQADHDDFHLVPNHKGELHELAQRIERRLGKGFPLAKYVEEGFAYHHGQLPDDLRNAIEEAFRQEHLAILIASPTLAQGVNLPIHLMIVANLERGDAGPFLVRDFRNIAGRAGRALHETEGHVIFVQKTQSSWLLDQMYQYLRDDRIESVRSVLFKLYGQIVKRKLGISLQEFLKNPQSMAFAEGDVEQDDRFETDFQTQVLVMLYEQLLDEADPNSVESTLDKLLFGVQSRGHTFYGPLVEYTKHQIRYITSKFTSVLQKKAYYRTGLSIRSCSDLEREIRRLAGDGVLTQLRDPNTGVLASEKMVRIFRLIAMLPETAPRYSGTVDLARLMVRWIDFANISDLVAENSKEDPVFENPLAVSDLVYRHFMNDGPWALNSLVKILAYLSEEEGLNSDPEAVMTPSYLKYGVNTPVAAYLCGMGIGDRAIARALASHFYNHVHPALLPSLENFQDWVLDLRPEDLMPILQDDRLVAEALTVFRRYKLDSRPVDSFIHPDSIDIITYVVGLAYEGREAHLQTIRKGDALKLLREPDNRYDPYAIAVLTLSLVRVGYIRSSRAFTLSTLLDEGLRFNCIVDHVDIKTRFLNRALRVRITPAP